MVLSSKNMRKQRFDRHGETPLGFSSAMTPSDPARREHTSLRLERGFSDGADEPWTMVAELISAIVTWAGIGWLSDRWLDTAPWLLMLGILIGSVLGVYLVLLRSNRMMREAMASRVAGRSPSDGETTEGVARGKD
jgi:ATP synthase protein I